MATTRIKKEEIVEFLTNSVATQKSVVLLTTKDSKKSLDSETNTDFRKQARNLGIIVKVVKNTITKKVFPTVAKLDGQTYIAYAENFENTDEITVPKIIIKLGIGDFKDNFTVVGAMVNGEFYNSSDAIKLSLVPSKQESMAMVAGTLKALMAKVPTLVKEVSSKLARSVNEVSKQKS